MKIINYKEINGSYYLTEGGLSRILQHSETTGFIAISAKTSEMNEKEAEEATKLLIQDIRNAGLGYNRLIGGYSYKADSQVIPDVEPSLFIPYMDKYSEDEFLQIAKDLSVKYGQWAFLIKFPSQKEIYNYERENLKPTTKNFERQSIGTFHAESLENLLNSYWSQLDSKHNKGKTRWTYKFEGVRVPINNLARMSFSKRGEIVFPLVDKKLVNESPDTFSRLYHEFPRSVRTQDKYIQVFSIEDIFNTIEEQLSYDFVKLIKMYYDDVIEEIEGNYEGKLSELEETIDRLTIEIEDYKKTKTK